MSLLISCQLLAQVKFSTQVSQAAVAERQTFQVQYTIEGANSIRQFELPRFTNFQVAEVFDVSNSVYNGKTSTDTYSKIVVLLATKRGHFTVPGATATINGKPMRSNSKTVDVLKSSVALAIPNINPDDIDTEEESILHPGENIDEKVKKNFFLRVEPSKTTCYVGEPLMVTYKAYSRLNANSQVMKRPSLTGFSVMEMVDAYDGKPEIEKLNGRLYYTNLIRKVQLFPLQEGTYKLDPAEIESVIHFVKTDEPADKNDGVRRLLDHTSIYTPVNHRTILRTDSLTITVKPLPAANQPDNFSGAVGHYSLAVKVPSAAVHKGDLVKIQVVITGSGNISLLTPPDIEWPAGVDTAEPAVKENVNKYAFPLAGSKTFEYSFAAPDTGNYVIPAVRFSYFDPAANEYKTAKTDSITMHVLPALHRNDAHSIVKGGETSIPKQFYWFAAVALVIVGSIVFQVVLLGKGKKKEAPKSEEAVFVPPSPLLGARQALEQNNQHDFYNEVQQALWKVMADKYKVLPSQWNKHTIEEVLPADVVKPFEAVLDECEWALYTPNHSISSMEATLARAEEVVKRLT